jgi:hypothetical protein
VPDDPQTPPPAGPLVPLEVPVQPQAGGHPSAPADDPGTGAGPASPWDGQVPPADADASVEIPPPPYAPVVPLAVVDDGPPVPPELDDLLPPPSPRRPVSSPTGRYTKKGDANRRSEPVMSEAPPWDYGPVPSTAPASTTASPGAAPRSDRSAGQEVAAPAQVALPTVKEASRRLTSTNARNSLSAMALTLIVGTAWNVVSARRRRSGWY